MNITRAINPFYAARVRGAAAGGVVDREQPGGEVQRLERVGAV